MSMIDYHCHIIPDVDDGCHTFEEALQMIKEEVSEGITTFVATPHYFHKRYETPLLEIKENFEEVKKRAKEAGIEANFVLGQEICYSTHVDLTEMLKNGEIMTLSGTNYILLEFNSNIDKENIPEIIYDFVTSGYKVVLAHVDRYDWMDADTIVKSINEGALIQINAASLLGECGWKKKRFVKTLLKNNLVSFIGSDCHIFRRTHLGKALEIAKTKYGFENPDIKDLI